jgi:PPOX class probable F420-dependent enzyme
MAELSDKAREILEKKTFVHVGTLMGDGAPQVSPVWVNVDGGDVIFNTAEGRIKPQNLQRDSRIALSAIDPDDDYKSVLIRGKVTEITGEGADEHINSLAKKYMDVDEYPFRQDGEVRLIVRVEPEREMLMG